MKNINAELATVAECVARKKALQDEQETLAASIAEREKDLSHDDAEGVRKLLEDRARLPLIANSIRKVDAELANLGDGLKAAAVELSRQIARRCQEVSQKERAGLTDFLKGRIHAGKLEGLVQHILPKISSVMRCESLLNRYNAVLIQTINTTSGLASAIESMVRDLEGLKAL